MNEKPWLPEGLRTGIYFKVNLRISAAKMGMKHLLFSDEQTARGLEFLKTKLAKEFGFERIDGDQECPTVRK